MSNKLTKLDENATSKLLEDIQTKLEHIVWDLSAKHNAHEFIVIEKMREEVVPYLEHWVAEAYENSEELHRENYDPCREEKWVVDYNNPWDGEEY